MSLFMKFETLFHHELKIIGQEHDFLQNFAYINNYYTRNNFQSKTGLASCKVLFLNYLLFLLQVKQIRL